MGRNRWEFLTEEKKKLMMDPLGLLQSRTQASNLISKKVIGDFLKKKIIGKFFQKILMAGNLTKK